MDAYIQSPADFLKKFNLPQTLVNHVIDTDKLELYFNALLHKKFKPLTSAFANSYNIISKEVLILFQKYLEQQKVQNRTDHSLNRAEKIATFTDYVASNLKTDQFTEKWKYELIRYECEAAKLLSSEKKYKWLYCKYNIDWSIKKVKEIDKYRFYIIDNLLKPKYSPRLLLLINHNEKIKTIAFCYSMLSPCGWYKHVSNKNVGAYAKKIKQSLNAQGYYFVEKPITLNEFYILANKLGVIINRQDVYINPNMPHLFLQPQKLSFHTDRSEPDYIGWFCVENDKVGGESCFFVCDDLTKKFTRKELKQLCQVCNIFPNGPKSIAIPVLASVRKKFKIYYHICYHPWEKVIFKNAFVQEPIYKKFTKYLMEKEMHHQVNIKLKPGQVLFINNRFVLHGRAKIKEDTKRLLKRVWIKSVG